MEVLGTLADAPTAAIAVVAIGLGLLFAARGPKGERRQAGGPPDERPQGAGGANDAAPVMFASMPAAPPAETGFVGPEGSVVGHGPIHLGGGGPLGASVPVPEPAPVPEPVVEPQPVAEREPEPISQPVAEPQPEPIPQPDAAQEPEAAAETAPPAPAPGRFKHGRIRLGGRSAGKPPTDR